MKVYFFIRSGYLIKRIIMDNMRIEPIQLFIIFSSRMVLDNHFIYLLYKEAFHLSIKRTIVSCSARLDFMGIINQFFRLKAPFCTNITLREGIQVIGMIYIVI